MRVQQSVIIILNSSVPRTIRGLNQCCAFKSFLTACLLQCLYNNNQQFAVASIIKAWLLCVILRQGMWPLYRKQYYY